MDNEQANIESVPKAKTVISRLNSSQRQALYEYLLALSIDGILTREIKVEAAKAFKVSTQTVNRIWKKKQESNGNESESDSESSIARQPTRKSRYRLSFEEKQAVYVKLLLEVIDGKLRRGAISQTAKEFSYDIKTVMRIWKEGQEGTLDKKKTNKMEASNTIKRIQKGKRNLTKKQKREIYEHLLVKSFEGFLPYGAVNETAQKFSVDRKTVGRIWKKGHESKVSELFPADLSNNKNSGRKPIQIDIDKVNAVPDEFRLTYTSFAKVIGVSVNTLLRNVEKGTVQFSPIFKQKRS